MEPTSIPSDWRSRRGPAAGVEGLSGRIRLKVGETAVGVLEIADSSVAIGDEDEAEASLSVDTTETLVGLLGGDIQPIVARLQGRAFALRALFGLQAGSPWSGLAPRS
jgi:hypothetical protein